MCGSTGSGCSCSRSRHAELCSFGLFIQAVVGAEAGVGVAIGPAGLQGATEAAAVVLLYVTLHVEGVPSLLPHVVPVRVARLRKRFSGRRGVAWSGRRSSEEGERWFVVARSWWPSVTGHRWGRGGSVLDYRCL